jgi:hypothetical protein
VRLGLEAMLYPKDTGKPMRAYVGDLPEK